MFFDKRFKLSESPKLEVFHISTRFIPVLQNTSRYSQRVVYKNLHG